MKKWFIFSVLLFLFGYSSAQNNLELAKGAFIEGDFKTTANQLYSYLQKNFTQDEELYSQAILSFLHEQDSIKSRELTNLALQRGVKVESLLNKMWDVARLTAMPSLYNNIRILAKQSNEPYADAAKNSLINHYLESKDKEATIALLETSTIKADNIQLLTLLAQTYASLNKDSLAMITYKRITNIEPNNYDANSYIGIYYYVIGSKKLIKTHPAKLVGLQYEEMSTERKQIIETDIIQSLAYLEKAITIKSNEQLIQLINEEHNWLNELTQKKTITKKERKKIDKANRKSGNPRITLMQ